MHPRSFDAWRRIVEAIIYFRAVMPVRYSCTAPHAPFNALHLN